MKDSTGKVYDGMRYQTHSGKVRKEQKTWRLIMLKGKGPWFSGRLAQAELIIPKGEM